MRYPGKVIAAAGALLGCVIAIAAYAPASWLARGLAAATGEHLLIVDTRGSVWNGSGVLVLAGGAGSHGNRDAAYGEGLLVILGLADGILLVAVVVLGTPDFIRLGGFHAVAGIAGGG